MIPLHYNVIILMYVTYDTAGDGETLETLEMERNGLLQALKTRYNK